MNKSSEDLNQRVIRIKFQNDEINTIIQEYKPFIASTVQKYVGRYVSYGEDDELSIGLMAFEEAIKHYDNTKGSFLGFAKTVIHRRLIDYYRKEKKHQKQIYINDYCRDSEDGKEIYEYSINTEQSTIKYEQEQINEIRKLELIELKSELSKYGLKFSDISSSSPKHKKTKKMYLDIVNFIMNNKDLIKRIKAKMYLPVKEIELGTGIPRKTIERSRNYVIAVIIILNGDYGYISEFIDWGCGK